MGLNKMTTETIDRLFLELSQVTKAKTQREILLEAALASANAMCRSAYQIASRKGEHTGWEDFTARLEESLVIQHKVMHPETYGESQ